MAAIAGKARREGAEPSTARNRWVRLAAVAQGEEILAYLLEVASGRKSKSEDLGYGGAEFVPWQVGAVM